MSKEITKLLEFKHKEETHQAALAIVQYEEEAPSFEMTQALSKEEYQIFSEYKFDKRKGSYLSGRYAAKKAISALTNFRSLQQIQIKRGVFQFPIVRGTNKEGVHISITHSNKTAVAIAHYDQFPCGVDLEQVNSENLHSIKTNVSQAEKALLGGFDLPEDHFYTTLWTAKEGLSKIIKTGLTTPFDLFEVSSFQMEEKWSEYRYKNFAQYKSMNFLFDNQSLSLVIPKESALVTQLESFQI